MEQIPLTHVLFLSSALFFLGIYGFFSRRNLITMLMSVELILNSVNINFVAFNKYLFPHQLEGIFFTLFIITVAADRGLFGYCHYYQPLPQIQHHRY